MLSDSYLTRVCEAAWSGRQPDYDLQCSNRWRTSPIDHKELDRCEAWSVDQERIQNMSEPDRSVFRDMKVMYQTGKGNHLVPFLVPADTMSALDKLCDVYTRNDCGVLSSNTYLFPSTNNSAEHVYGWLAVHKVAEAAGVERVDLVTATRVRHRVSTLYAALDIPPNQRSNFYQHMGNSSIKPH